MNISKHQYYYHSTGTKQGVKPTTSTLTISGNSVENSIIVAEIKKIHENPDTRYGYIKMTYEFKTKGYIINKKKMYRLMKEAHLLGRKYKHAEKSYAKYRKVLPEGPLQVLEMEIKFVWVEQARKHAYILTVIDTFTRLALCYSVSFSITKNDVRKVWEHIVINHLQPNDCLNNTINIEVINDNDKRFSAQLVRDFFKDNHIDQVFTHPYTPQENAHVESFHAILSDHLKPYTFWSLNELKQNLILFYEFYNNARMHGSIAYTAPRIFRELWNKNLITKIVDEEKRKITFKLKIPYHEITQHTGNNEPEGSSLHGFEKTDINHKMMISADASIQPTV